MATMRPRALCASFCEPARRALVSALFDVSRGTARMACATGRKLGCASRALVQGERLLLAESKVLRQPLVNRLIHWSVALSILSLFFSGFGQMPLYKRYMVSDLPGMAWTADFGATLALHYAGAAMLMFAVSFHLAYHGLRAELGFLPRRGDLRKSILIVKAMVTGEDEPPAEKYLAEQRLAYAVIGINVLVLVVTGMIKAAKNLSAVDMNVTLIALSTHLHNLGMVLLLLTIVAHLVAFAIPANRRLLPGMVHGKVDLDYVKHRHCLWCDHLLAVDRGEPARGAEV